MNPSRAHELVVSLPSISPISSASCVVVVVVVVVLTCLVGKLLSLESVRTPVDSSSLMIGLFVLTVLNRLVQIVQIVL